MSFMHRVCRTFLYIAQDTIDTVFWMLNCCKKSAINNFHYLFYKQKLIVKAVSKDCPKNSFDCPTQLSSNKASTMMMMMMMMTMTMTTMMMTVTTRLRRQRCQCLQNQRTEHREPSNPSQPSVTNDMTSSQRLHQNQPGTFHESHGQPASQYVGQGQPMPGHRGPSQTSQLATSSDVEPSAIRSSFTVGVCNSVFWYKYVHV